MISTAMNFIQPTPISHDELICRGECPLSNPDFIERTRSYALELSKKVCQKLSIAESSISESVVDLEEENVVRLNDEILHIEVAICCDGREYVEEVLENLMEMVENDIKSEEEHQRNKPTFNHFIWTLSWLATSACDLNRLEQTLTEQKGSQVYPKCFLQSLLLNCIRAHFVDGVRFLLQLGAKPNRYHWRGVICTYLPITFAITEFPSLLHSGDEINMNEVEKLEKIVQVLVEKAYEETGGKSPFSNNGTEEDEEFSDQNSLKFLADVALLSKKTSKLLIDYGIEAMTRGCFLKDVLEDMVATFDEYTDPLRNPRENRVEKKRSTALVLLERMILPLLHSGARHDSPDLSYFDEFLQGTPSNDIVCETIWGRRNVFNEMLVEMCEFNGGQVVACFNYAPKCYFPMDLSHSCRRSILKMLPIGLETRKNAIEGLELPDLLKNFLRYPEFDLNPEVVQHFQLSST